MKPSRLLAAIATAAAALATVPAAPAAAALQLVEPGDRLETASNACTLGWVYIGADKLSVIVFGVCWTVTDVR